MKMDGVTRFLVRKAVKPLVWAGFNRCKLIFAPWPRLASIVILALLILPLINACASDPEPTIVPRGEAIQTLAIYRDQGFSLVELEDSWKLGINVINTQDLLDRFWKPLLVLSIPKPSIDFSKETLIAFASVTQGFHPVSISRVSVEQVIVECQRTEGVTATIGSLSIDVKLIKVALKNTPPFEWGDRLSLLGQSC